MANPIVDDFSDLDGTFWDTNLDLTSSSRASSDYGDDDDFNQQILEYDDSHHSTKAERVSRESPDYADEDYEQLIREYDGSQPSTQRVASSGELLNASTNTISSMGSTSTALASSGTTSPSIEINGKRKASEMLSQEPLPKRHQPALLERFAKAGKETERPTEDLVINSPPPMMAHLFASLPYGAQFELARMVNNDKIKYENINLDSYFAIKNELKTNVTAVPRIKTLIGSSGDIFSNKSEDPFAHLFEKENRARNPWEELDKEEVQLAKSPYGAMGYKEDGSPSDWCGGQVEFRGSLQFTNSLTLRLEKPTLGPSSQFTRRFGSKYFFRVKLSRAIQQKASTAKIFSFFQRPFILCGGVFRAFYAKDDNIFLFRTNERWDGTCIETPGNDSDGMSLLEFIEWHNPMGLNLHQAMAKWASRFSLGLSTSGPGYCLPREAIRFRDDIINPETKANMTDGAGSLNRCLVRQLRHRYDWNERPSTFQVRVHGGKGLLIEDIDDQSEAPIIFLTPSQLKIKYPPSDTDPAHVAIDILRASHLRTPCRLSAETVVNLGENGVPIASFITLLAASLRETVTAMLSWDSPQALLELWATVQRHGGVISARHAREKPGFARVNGLSERDQRENENEDEDGLNQSDEAEKRSSAWWADPISGCPSSLEETVLGLLDSGFEPQSCPVLREKLKSVIEGYIRREVESFHIKVPMSATGFIVPDCKGVLAEGEVFIKSSSRNLVLTDGTYTDILVGDVLLARHPCKLPTDIRKWKAVDRPELHLLADVIVLPTRGLRRAADWLAGGDYDGDKAIVIWQPDLVVPFCNADAKYADPPEDMNNFFEKEVESVPDFMDKISAKTIVETIHDLQYHLLGAIRNASVVGMYSNYHDYAIYTLGYTHPTTRRLAFMFCMTLDGAKTGMSVKREVIEQDRRQFNRRAPAWKETEEERKWNANTINPVRPSNLRRFILDDLCKEAKRQGEIWRKFITDTLNSCSEVAYDADLAAPYNEILRKSKEPRGGHFYLGDLDVIRKHVEEVYEEHIKRDRTQRRARDSFGVLSSPKKDKPKASAFTNLRIESRQDILRALSHRFASGPKTDKLHMIAEDVKYVRASYAFVYDCERRREKGVKWSRFPWDVAFRDLCDIKAKALGNHKTVTGAFYDRMNVKPPKTV